MTKMTYAQAVTQTLERLMREDDRIIMIYGGIGAPLPFGLPKDLRHRGFGMPLAELGYAGAATGAAVESTMKASFSRLTRTLSVKGRMVLPMISELA